MIPHYDESNPINSPYKEQSKPSFNPSTQGNTPYSKEPYKEPYKKPSEQMVKAPQPLIDLQIYPEAIKKPMPLAPKQPSLPFQPFTFSTPFMPPQIQSNLNNFMRNYDTPFIYKDYHINLGGPNGDHLVGSMIYEDALPPSEIYSSYKTLKERNVLCEYIRGTFIKLDEGELVDWSGGPNSLNSRLKLIELNPYNTNSLSSNPYIGPPEEFKIYKSCYPIIYDKQSTMVQCNKSSTGLNVRIYDLNLEEYIVKYYNVDQKIDSLKKNPEITKKIEDIINNINTNTTTTKTTSAKTTTTITTINKKSNDYNYNVWREIYYYAWIRNKINFNYISPNFISSYCYFITQDATKNVIGDKTNYKLTLLTESPNYNIYQWASNLYSQDKGIRKMINSGYKTESHWKSVIAQILIIFYIMDKHKFTINEMNIESNFYIKILNVYGDNKQFWQYTIDNIDFYIPNFGILVMLDHNYKKLSDKSYKKILMNDVFVDDVNNIQQTILNNAIKCLDSNNFGSNFTKNGGVELPENVKIYLNDINKKLTDCKSSIPVNLWIDVIKTYLLDYVHNRVGTPIRDIEVNYINKFDTGPKKFKVGELVAQEVKYNTYKILLVIDISSSNLECVSRNKSDTNKIEKISVSDDLLYHYSEYDSIKQDSKPGEPFIGNENIIERYIL